MIRRTGGGEYASRRRPNCSGVSGQYVRMLRSDRASAGNDGLGRAESRPGRIGPINLDVKQMGERNAGNPHVAFDVAGAGDVAWSRGISAKAGAPVLDPTERRTEASARAIERASSDPTPVKPRTTPTSSRRRRWWTEGGRPEGR